VFPELLQLPDADAQVELEVAGVPDAHSAHVQHAAGLRDLDDRVGNGRINPVKKWWWDLDTDDEGRVVKARRVNERQLAFREPLTPEQQKLGCYPAEAVPEPTAGPTPPDRKAAMAAYRDALSPAEYRRRKGSG
jgi:hypothetical protein